MEEIIDSSYNTENEYDPVDKPKGYNSYSIETIDAIKGQSTPAEFKGYLKGNIMKYVARYEYKNGAEDLKKARWYIDKLIETVEEDEG